MTFNRLEPKPWRERRQRRRAGPQQERAPCDVAAARVADPGGGAQRRAEAAGARAEWAAQSALAVAVLAVLVLCAFRLARSADEWGRPVVAGVEGASGGSSSEDGTASMPSDHEAEPDPLVGAPVIPTNPPPSSRPSDRSI